MILMLLMKNWLSNIKLMTMSCSNIPVGSHILRESFTPKSPINSQLMATHLNLNLQNSKISF